MNKAAEFAADIVRLNGNELVGKTRFQKTAYFLEAANVGYGFDFEYYHYGPYSEELALGIEDALALENIQINWKQSSRLQPFAVFSSLSSDDENLDETASRRKSVLQLLNGYDSISLELAATADFLEKSGYEDPWSETRNRKPTKSTEERFAKAKKLLSEFRSLS
jgi:uncharacterized protein YwgA